MSHSQSSKRKCLIPKVVKEKVIRFLSLGNTVTQRNVVFELTPSALLSECKLLPSKWSAPNKHVGGDSVTFR